MTFLAGLLLGALCGALELYLLNLLTSRITGGGTVPFWIIPAKMGVLAVFFVPVALFLREQLAYAGIAAAVVLMGGAIGIFIGKKRKGGASK